MHVLDIQKVFRKTFIEKKYYLILRDFIQDGGKLNVFKKDLNFNPRNDSSFYKLSKLQIENQEEA